MMSKRFGESTRTHLFTTEHATVLLGPLESLSATVEETQVRDKAVESLCKVAEAIPNDQFKDQFVILIKRLVCVIEEGMRRVVAELASSLRMIS
jgi:hypothetical protein